jgi:signal recognition particle subunit SRP54
MSTEMRPMFENLSERLGGVFDRLTKAGALSEADVVTALREVRTALLEAVARRPRLHQARD